MLILGDKEVAGDSVSTRLRTGEQLPAELFVQFKAKILRAIDNKARDFEL